MFAFIEAEGEGRWFNGQGRMAKLWPTQGMARERDSWRERRATGQGSSGVMGAFNASNLEEKRGGICGRGGDFGRR